MFKDYIWHFFSSTVLQREFKFSDFTINILLGRSQGVSLEMNWEIEACWSYHHSENCKLRTDVVDLAFQQFLCSILCRSSKVQNKMECSTIWGIFGYNTSVLRREHLSTQAMSRSSNEADALRECGKPS